MDYVLFICKVFGLHKPFPDYLSLLGYFIVNSLKMDKKDGKPIKMVFDDDSDNSDSEELNQLHVNKEYKEKYNLMTCF